MDDYSSLIILQIQFSYPKWAGILQRWVPWPSSELCGLASVGILSPPCFTRLACTYTHTLQTPRWWALKQRCFHLNPYEASGFGSIKKPFQRERYFTLSSAAKTLASCSKPAWLSKNFSEEETVIEDGSNLTKYSFICTRHPGSSNHLNLVHQQERSLDC